MYFYWNAFQNVIFIKKRIKNVMFILHIQSEFRFYSNYIFVSKISVKMKNL